MSTQPIMPKVDGLPPGAVLRPLQTQTQDVEGLPPGAVVKSLPPSATSTPSGPIPIYEGYRRAGNVLKEAGKDLLGAVGGMADTAFSPGIGPAFKLGQGIVGGHMQAYQDAKDAAEKGQTTKSIFKSVAAGVPIVGPMSSDIYDSAEAGNNDEALGKGISRTLQVMSIAPEGSVIPNPASGTLGLMSKVKLPSTPDLGAKVSAVGKLAGQDALSHIPILGRVVRRPSFVDYLEAAKTTADPQLSLFNKTPKLGDSPLFSSSPELAPQPAKFNDASLPPQLQLPAGPRITPPPADTSGSVPFTPPPFSNTTRAQRLGLMLSEKASGPIELGPGEILPPEREGLLPAAPRFLVDKGGNPRVQFLTSAATDQVAAPNIAPESAQSLFRNAPPAKPGLLDGIKEHEFLSKVQDELSGQPDEAGQAQIQGWMEAHNQQAPGAKGPGLMNRAALADIEQANAKGQSLLPPEEPQASPGLMNKAKGSKGGPSSPAQATPAAQRPPVQPSVPQPQLATEENMGDLLQKSLEMARGKKGPGLVGKNAKEPTENRGQYPDLRAEFDKMSPEDQVRGHFISEKTDLPNRKAFDIAEKTSKSPAVAMSDADGLKALNDKFGYDAGDALLKAKADALKEAGVEGYHDKGDEFLYRGNSPQDLETKLEAANGILKNKVIQVETADGKVLKFKGAEFSHGAGENIGAAETQLKAHKADREAAGQRKRGELGGIKEVK